MCFLGFCFFFHITVITMSNVIMQVIVHDYCPFLIKKALLLQQVAWTTQSFNSFHQVEHY